MSMHATATARPLSLAISSSSLPPQDGGNDDTQNDTLLAGRRRGVRESDNKHVLARGLARRFESQRGRAEALQTQITRQAKQLAMLEEYNRHQETASTTAERRGGDMADKTRAVAPDKLLKRERHRAQTVDPVPAFVRPPRKTGLRAHSSSQSNQSEEMTERDATQACINSTNDATKLQSPTDEDVAQFAELAMDAPDSRQPPSPNKLSETMQPLNTSYSRPTLRGSSIDKSTAQVLCELHVTKEIVVREQTLQQLRTLLPVLESLAEQLSGIIEKQARATARLNAAATSPVREKRGSSSSLTVAPLSTWRPESGNVAVATFERDVQQLTAQFSELASTARRRMQQFVTLLTTLREATMRAADALVEWRRLREQRCRLTNFRPLFRFPWCKLRVANYLAHMHTDVHFIVATAALHVALVLDSDTPASSALLLPLHVIEALGLAGANDDAASITTTFLTERRSDDNVAAHRRAQYCNALRAALQIDTPTLPTAGGDAMRPPSIAAAMAIDLLRARRCLEILQHEQALERDDAAQAASEQQRVAAAYNPFATIKAVGGVEQALAQLVATQAPHTTALMQQLRERQEDTTRAVELTATDASAAAARCESSAPLRVNAQRLHHLFAKRTEQASGAGDSCDVRPPVNAKRNKLRGQVVVRKLTLRRQQHACARTIQRQFRVHALRTHVLQSLTLFLLATRKSAALIQRVFRGFGCRRQAAALRAVRNAVRRRVDAARCILYAYRRYRRRRRHCQPMTVEAIAQAQLFALQCHKLQDGGGIDAQAVEGYRRVGEERRRQRVVLLQRRRLEQIALESQRSAAATRLQAFVRGHLAKNELAHLRHEQQAHLTAVGVMTLQSQVRRFLQRQDVKRQRFRQDLERVNRSAVRIQSIYRGYNSRVSLMDQLDASMLQQQVYHRDDGVVYKDEDDTSDDDEKDMSDKLPLLGVRSTGSTSSNRDDGLDAMLALLTPDRRDATVLPPIRPTRASISPLSARRSSFQRPHVASAAPLTPYSIQAMTRVELELKRPLIGDDFDATKPQRRTRGA